MSSKDTQTEARVSVSPTQDQETLGAFWAVAPCSGFSGWRQASDGSGFVGGPLMVARATVERLAHDAALDDMFESYESHFLTCRAGNLVRHEMQYRGEIERRLAAGFFNHIIAR